MAPKRKTVGRFACSRCLHPTDWPKRGLCPVCYRKSKRPPKDPPKLFRVCYDDPASERVGLRTGPGKGLPSFDTLQEARDACRVFNDGLNAKLGRPERPPFPMFFVDSDQCFMLGKDGDEE